jgi:hypothetical protein
VRLRCASQAAGPPPPYEVVGSVGLIVTPAVTPVRVRMPDDEYVSGIEAKAEAKRNEAKKGVGATALTILTAPLAILAPLYPPAIQLAALPFMAADATAKASKEADQLTERAAQARRDAACAKQLSAAHPDLIEVFPHVLEDESLRHAIEEEVRNALSARARTPVVLVTAGADDVNPAIFPFVKEAKARALPTVVNVGIVGIDLSAEAAAEDPASCRYAVLGTAALSWWDVEKNLLVYRNDALTQTRLPLEGLDLAALLDRRDELRSRIASAVRDAAAGTFDAPALKFSGSSSQP